MKTQIVAYRDTEFASMWIDDKAHYPDRFAEFLVEKGIPKVNAEQLRQFMQGGIENRDATDRVVVFAQDVMPDTIVEDVTSHVTVREFLDSGGSILWFGDIPLFYLAEKNKQLQRDFWMKAAPVHVLGIVPLFVIPKTAVDFTDRGRSLGLKYHWSGTRPVLEDRNIDVLAKSESLLANYYLNTPPRGFWRKLWSRLKSVQVSSTLIPADVKLELHPSEDRALMTHFHEVHANAWVKRYSTTHSDSGFFRIWDYGPRNVTGAQLEELYEIVKRICM